PPASSTARSRRRRPTTAWSPSRPPSGARSSAACRPTTSPRSARSAARRPTLAIRSTTFYFIGSSPTGWSNEATELIKVCPDCGSTWAGGRACEDCGGILHDPYAKDAAEALPKGIWKYIRLQYGARRGMLVRVMAFLTVPVVFGVLARRAVLLPGAWLALGLAGAALASILAFL